MRDRPLPVPPRQVVPGSCSDRTRGRSTRNQAPPRTIEPSRRRRIRPESPPHARVPEEDSRLPAADRRPRRSHRGEGLHAPRERGRAHSRKASRSVASACRPFAVEDRKGRSSGEETDRNCEWDSSQRRHEMAEFCPALTPYRVRQRASKAGLRFTESHDSEKRRKGS